MSHSVVITLMVLVFLCGLSIINLKLSKVRKNQVEVTIDHIERHTNTKKFLINYQCQVKCFALCLDYHNKTGEWSTFFFDPHLKYYLDGEFLSLCFENEMYAIGKIPKGFPVGKLHGKGKTRMWDITLLTDHTRNLKHEDR